MGGRAGKARTEFSTLPDRTPRLTPARAPPQTEIDFDQTPHWDRIASVTLPTNNPPSPGFDPLDQSLHGDDGTWSA